MGKLGRGRLLALLGVLLASLTLKGALVAAGVVSLDSDEAIVGLMARHILEGARPVFFYGQGYMGSLDAWLVAGSFVLFGPSVWAIRLVQLALFSVHTALTYVLARLWSGDERTALLSTLLMAFPPVLLTLYTTVSLGGYGELLVLGDLVLLIGWMLANDGQAGIGWWALLGALAGVGFWTLGLIAVYLLPLGVLLLWRHRLRAWRGYLVAGSAFAIGSSPWWMYNIEHAWVGVRELYDAAAMADPMAPVLPIHMRSLGLLLIGLPGLVGLRLPWSAAWLSLPIVPPVAMLYGAMSWRAAREAKCRAWRGAYVLLWGVVLTFCALFCLSRFGSDPTGRYLLPLYTPLTLFAAAALVAWGRNVRWSTAVFSGLLLALHLWGTYQGASSAEGLTAQYNAQLQYGNSHDEELVSFLEEHSGARGYTHYWIAFKIAFLSDERVILAPSLPHKASLQVVAGDSRYAAYSEMVARAERVVYVTGNQPRLEESLRRGFSERGIAYREHTVGPYRVFYDLSSRVSPPELELE